MELIIVVVALIALGVYGFIRHKNSRSYITWGIVALIGLLINLLSK